MLPQKIFYFLHDNRHHSNITHIKDSTFFQLQTAKVLVLSLTYDLQLKPVKYIFDILSPVLTHTFINLALSTGSLPELMQIAEVTVMNKDGDVNSLAHYRPISLLPIFFKAVEEVIHYRLTHFLGEHACSFRQSVGFPQTKIC